MSYKLSLSRVLKPPKRSLLTFPVLCSACILIRPLQRIRRWWKVGREMLTKYLFSWVFRLPLILLRIT